jgi:hypothetical protein
MDHFRQPLRYNITVQWSDRHNGYICFVNSLIKSAKMFAPDMNMIGVGTSPEQAITDGLHKSYTFLSFLQSLAILPPAEEITPVSEFEERELTVQQKTSCGNY